MRIVLDTNVVVSALLWGGNPLRLIQAAVDGDVLLCTSPALLEELRDVLGRSHLASRLERRRSTIEQAIGSYAALAIVVTPSSVPAVVQADPDDDHVIAAATAATAALLVTGDRDLLDMIEHAGIRIVTPAQAVSLVRR